MSCNTFYMSSQVIPCLRCFVVYCDCSAGVGRSGVLMFVETAFEMIEGAEPIYPLEIVRRMRDQRASSIQTPVSACMILGF